ncbi:M43 family zinc metalloprotease [Aquimarina sediminis]|uniref:M43 family zinc metalloprotease n=1 Tax=Aquimarina sediminis TaxID=2070536 RepID=UPI0013E8AF79|nr:M43 family zinc metalloprotease [Aquimarina sediminis]
MKIKTFFLAVLLCGYAPSITGQQEHVDAKRCKTKNANDYIFSASPMAKAEYDNFNKYTKNFVQSKKLSHKAGETYTIPVVVHVYGTQQHGKTVDYNKVKGALDALNKDFNGLNDDFNSIDPVFDGRKSTLNIRFALAKIDPNGGSTNGVIIHPVASGMGNYNSPVVAADGWDNYKYMNVYITGDLYGDGVSNNSGVAWYPNTTMSNENIARVVYNGQYLHGNTNKEFASVFTHEFGHWLNLIHTFEGGCNDPNGDQVSDTPKEDSNSGDKGCTVGASECGNLINYENYMGYDSASGCAKMYTQGQVNRMLAALQHPTRKPLWQPANLIATGVNLTGASLVVANNTVEESLSNNGALVDEFYDIDIQGGTFSLNSGTLSEGTHFNSNLPQGISATITVVNNTKLRVTYNGSANNHAVVNNFSGSITLKNAIISGGTSVLNSDKVSFDFSFYDPYKVVYVDNDDYTANATTTWTFFRITGADSNSFGTFFENNALKLETYTKALVCQSGTRNPMPIAENTVISSTSSWVNGGAYPDLHVIRDSGYTAWDGKIAYIGFQLELYSGKTNYGWFRVQVNADGSSYTLLDYAYSTEPFGAIKAGSKIWGGGNNPTCNDGIQNGDETGIDCGGSCAPCVVISYCNSNGRSTVDEYISRVQLGTIDKTSVGESSGYADFTAESTILSKGNPNTITITPTWRATVYSEGYSVWIDYNQDGDFMDAGEQVWSKVASKATSVSGDFIVPSEAKNGNTRMRVSMKYNGIPSSCESFSYGEVEDYTVSIKTGGTPTCSDGIQNGDETGIDCGGSCIPCNTNDGVVYVDVNDISVNSSSTWNFFRIEVGDDKDYGAWYTSNSIRLVTYNKDIVCEGSSKNVTLIGEGTEVGPTSNFISESNSYVISSSGYTNWNGKSGYVGFTFKINNNTHYGWFYITVANDGLSYTILDYAYNTNPNQGLLTKRTAVASSVRTENLIKVYPNSFTQITNVDVTKLGKERFTISIYDMLGRRIDYKEYDKNPGVISLGEKIANKGSYFMKIKSKTMSEIHTLVKK